MMRRLWILAGTLTLALSLEAQYTPYMVYTLVNGQPSAAPWGTGQVLPGGNPPSMLCYTLNASMQPVPCAFGSSSTTTVTTSDSAQAALNIQLSSTQTAFAGSGIVRIALIGDSYAQGAGFTSFANALPSQITQWFQTNYGYGGTGIKTMDSGGGEWQAVAGCGFNANLGPTQSGFGTNFSTMRQCTGNANTATFKNSNGGGLYGDTLKIYCGLFTDSGNGFSVVIDGGAPTTVCNSTAGTYTASSATIVSAAGWHSVVLTWPAVGNAYPYAAEWISGTTGAVVDNYGRGGAVAASFGGTPAAELAFVQKPSGVIIIDGVNDFGNSVNPTTYQANMQGAVNYLQSTFSPAPTFLFLIQPFVTGTFTYTQAQYQAAEYALTVTAGAGYIDLQQRYLSLAKQQALGIENPDNIHLNDMGWRDVATLIENRLQKRMPEFLQDFMVGDSGAGNLYIGSTPGEGLGAAIKNTGIGYKSGGTGNFSNTGSNTWMGNTAFNSLTTGHNNAAFGTFACGSLTGGNFDDCFGQNADINASVAGASQVHTGKNFWANSFQWGAQIVMNTPTTFATAPGCAAAGSSTTVAPGSTWRFSDSNTTTVGAVIAGGGANFVVGVCGFTSHNWLVEAVMN